ncbi:hypothetical protein Ntsu_48870 [Nocardia sp. IFM 10818]
MQVTLGERLLHNSPDTPTRTAYGAARADQESTGEHVHMTMADGAGPISPASRGYHHNRSGRHHLNSYRFAIVWRWSI